MALRDPLREEIRRLRENNEAGPLADALVSLLSMSDVAKDRGDRYVLADNIERTIVRNVLKG